MGWATREEIYSFVRRRLTESGHDDSVLSIDFAAYDATVGGDILMSAYEAMGALYSDTNAEMIELLGEWHRTIPIIDHLGNPYPKRSGVASGSVFTNLVDSIVNLNLQTVSLGKFGMEEKEIFRRIAAQGDDGLLVTPGTVREFSDCASKYGFDANPEKQYSDIGPDAKCVFLQDYYLESIEGGIRPLSRVVNKMLGYERLRHAGKWRYDDDVDRWRQQLHAADWHFSLQKVATWLNGLTREGFQASRQINEEGLGFSKEAVESQRFSFPADLWRSEYIIAQLQD